MNGGYSTSDVHQYLALFAETRRDCVSILDMAPENQLLQAAVTYRTQQLDLNTSYAGIYSPDVQITDRTTGLTRFVCPSGFVGAAFAYTDTVAFPWFAAAGDNRGKISLGNGVRVKYAYPNDTDMLAQYQINPIIQRKGVCTIWGEQTLYYNQSPFQSMPVRRMLNQIEIIATDTVASSLFDPNDDFTRLAVTTAINNVLQPIKNNRGIYRYQTVCNSAINSNLDVSDRDLNVLVIIDPVLSVLRIKILGVVTSTGASFSEIITQQSSGSTLS
jgi:phage tail sheath protein FI